MKHKVGNNVKSISKLFSVIGVLSSITNSILNFVNSANYNGVENAKYIIIGLIWLLVGSVACILGGYLLYSFGHLINCVENINYSNRNNNFNNSLELEQNNVLENSMIDINNIKKNRESKSMLTGIIALVLSEMGFLFRGCSILGFFMGLFILVFCWNQISDDKSKLFKFRDNASFGFYAMIISLISFFSIFFRAIM